MPPVPLALDAIIRHFGIERVAEVTGRTQRIIVDATGRQKLQRRSKRSNIAETLAFMNGDKDILIFTDAGGIGRSYHAERGWKSANKRRASFSVEPGWNAPAWRQRRGRDHRTNQTVPPKILLVTTDCRGERRFLSTIARRLDSLGALTRGQRQTGGQEMFRPTDNLEGDNAREALVQWYHLLHAGKLKSTNLADFTRMTGLTLTYHDSGDLLERLPPIQRWLNRLLALRIATQNAIFDEFIGLLEARIDAAREAGTLDVGVETIAAERVLVLNDQLLRRDPRTGSETRLQQLELHMRRHAMSFDRLSRIWGGTGDSAYLWNKRSQRVALRVPSWAITDDEGRPVPMCQLIRPTGSDRVRADTFWNTHWTEIAEAEFHSLWNAEVAEAQTRTDVETINIATGLLLPVWHKLPSDDVKVWRITDAAGQSVLGRIVHAGALEALSLEFGLNGAVRLTPEQVLQAAKSAEGGPLPALGQARLTTALVNGQHRLEIRNFPPEKRDSLKALGCFTEIIGFKTRLFIPTNRAAEILSAIDRLVGGWGTNAA